ncbi:MAG: type II toxin-antitoxin system HicB family antitoxin [Candidatus Competibacteraceae bacterium]|nr:type II toxin-antitoxin system HicB family antitoxin [Candidatus Competibacteraceae bacterium]
MAKKFSTLLATRSPEARARIAALTEKLNSHLTIEDADLRYPAVFDPEVHGGYSVYFVDMEHAITDGETMEEASFNASKVLSAILGYYLDHGLPIREPSLEKSGTR